MDITAGVILADGSRPPVVTGIDDRRRAGNQAQCSTSVEFEEQPWLETSSNEPNRLGFTPLLVGTATAGGDMRRKCFAGRRSSRAQANCGYPIVDEDRINGLIARHWQASEDGDGDAEHDIYAPSAILDYPQSGERFRGRETIQAQRGSHPAERRFAVRRISGHADLWVSECVITYDGSPTYSVSIMEFENEHVVHETQYFADPFDAAPGRACFAERIPEIVQ
jgi:hypothetical protein